MLQSFSLGLVSFLLASTCSASRLSPSTWASVAWKNQHQSQGQVGDYGACPEDNAVCVAIRMRNPVPSATCTVRCSEVGVRLKAATSCSRCVEIDEEDRSRPGTYKQHLKAYDVVFPYSSGTGAATNHEVFEHLVAPTLAQSFGCEEDSSTCKSAAFFAYGATGSGKSYTMGFESDSTEGMLQRSVSYMYDSLERLRAAGHPLGTSTSVFMIFFQIYGNARGADSKVYDLLRARPEPLSKGIGFDKILYSMSFKEVANVDDVMREFKSGLKHRAVESTNMNAVSSRSHAVVQFYISPGNLNEAATEAMSGAAIARSAFADMIKHSIHLSFVDLAGSEPAANNDNELRRHEGIAVNQALTSLRKCMSSAAKGESCAYRENALTLMLKDLFDRDEQGQALAFTRMLAMINPSADPKQLELSRGTLTYANTVKEIKVAIPQGQPLSVPLDVNEEQALIAELKKTNGDLEAQIAELMRNLQEKSRRKSSSEAGTMTGKSTNEAGTMIGKSTNEAGTMTGKSTKEASTMTDFEEEIEGQSRCQNLRDYLYSWLPSLEDMIPLA